MITLLELEVNGIMSTLLKHSRNSEYIHKEVMKRVDKRENPKMVMDIINKNLNI